MMDSFSPFDVTEKARGIFQQYNSSCPFKELNPRPSDSDSMFQSRQPRVPDPAGFIPRGKIVPRGTHKLSYGDREVHVYDQPFASLTIVPFVVGSQLSGTAGRGKPNSSDWGYHIKDGSLDDY